MTSYDRRDILRSMAAAGVLGAGVPLLSGCSKSDSGSKPGEGGSGAAQVDQKAINIVSLYGTSGPTADLGQEGVDGMKLVPALYDDKLLDRDFKIAAYDSQEKVDQAVQRQRDAAQAGQKFFVGGSLSNVALAIGAEANKSKTLFFTSAGADEITGKDCAQGMFRWSVATHAAIQQTVKPLVEKNPEWKKWYTITPNYVFGQSLLKNTREVLSAGGAKLLGNSFHSLEATEFSGIVNNAVNSKPDVLCLLNFGAQCSTTLSNLISIGAHKRMKILVAWGGGLTQVKALGADKMEGIYYGCQYWHTADTPGNKELLEAWDKAGHKGKPSYAHVTGYMGAKLFAEAIKKANSDDPAKVAKAMEGLSYEGPTGPESVRAGDHQVDKAYYLLQGKKKSDMADADDFMTVVSSGKSLPPLNETGCKLKPLGQ